MISFLEFKKDIYNKEQGDFLREVRSHPKVHEQLFNGGEISASDQQHWFEDIYSGDELSKIFLCQDDGKLVGYVQFNIDSVRHQRCEVGYALHPSHWNKGHGKRMIEWSISNTHLLNNKVHRLWLTVFPENEKAIKLYEKYGFEIESKAKDYIIKDDVFRTVVFMCLLLN